MELFIASWLGRIFRAAGGDTGDWGGEADQWDDEASRYEVSLQAQSLGSIAALDWPSLAKLHPLIEESDPAESDPAESDPAQSDALSPEDIGIRARELCRNGSWSRLRGAVASGEMPHSSITSEQAAWMDDSMFARWCLAAFPDTGELTEQLNELLPPELHQMLVECLEEQRG